MPVKVSYLGPQGTYAEEAALIMTKLEGLKDPELIPCIGIRSAIEQASLKECDAAVIPIENSVEGGVTTSLDGLWSHPNLFIKRALVLPIRHCLMSNGSIQQISEVLSHPQALAQCSGWLRKNLPNALQLATTSTSEAVNMVKGSNFRAAIASRSKINLSSLEELAYPVNDVSGNRTRFIFLQSKKIDQQGDIASLAFSLHANSPGALLEALSCIASLGLNMSRIESRPSKRELGEYVFFVDVDLVNKSSKDKHNELIKALQPLCDHLVDFGTYPSTEIETQ